MRHRLGGPLVKVLGSKATAALHRDRAVLRTAAGHETVFRSGVDSYEAQRAHFAGVVQKGTPPAVPPADALADLTLMAAICGNGPLARSQESPRERRKT
jgi:hypothetical protein